jgi:amino acid transporter
MSGDLRSPSRSIPTGTISAIGFTYVLYFAMAILLAGSTRRETLKNDLSVMSDVSYFPGFVTIGILSTSLFSTLGAVISAAKVLQGFFVLVNLIYSNIS